MGPTAKAVYKKLAPMVATNISSHTVKQSAGSSEAQLLPALLLNHVPKRIMLFCRQPQLTEAAIDQAICDSEFDMYKTLKFHNFLFHCTVLPCLFFFPCRMLKW